MDGHVSVRENGLHEWWQLHSMQWFVASNGGQVLYRQSKIWILNSCTNVVWWRKQGVSISQSITRKMWTRGDCPHFHRGPQDFMTLEPISRKSAHVFTIQKITIIILYVHVNTKHLLYLAIYTILIITNILMYPVLHTEKLHILL